MCLFSWLLPLILWRSTTRFEGQAMRRKSTKTPAPAPAKLSISQQRQELIKKTDEAVKEAQRLRGELQKLDEELKHRRNETIAEAVIAETRQNLSFADTLLQVLKRQVTEEHKQDSISDLLAELKLLTSSDQDNKGETVQAQGGDPQPASQDKKPLQADDLASAISIGQYPARA
jgi:hypothetical protein